MSTEILSVRRITEPSDEGDVLHYGEQPRAHRADGPAKGSDAIQEVWCAPMTEAGEWVVTWTRVTGAAGYEVQHSLDGKQWSSSSKFSGARAVLFLGPTRRCWVRVRAIGLGAPCPWSAPKMGEKGEQVAVVA